MLSERPTTRPQITTAPAEQDGAQEGEQIIGFSDALSESGGLIAFRRVTRTTAGGDTYTYLRIELYQCAGRVQCVTFPSWVNGAEAETR